MTACIKTGCKVYFGNYGQLINADLYKVGNCYIVRTHAGQLERADEENFKPEDCPKDIVVWADSKANEEFWRPDLGVFVVRAENVTFVDLTNF